MEKAHVFDKAAWHLDAVRGHGLPDAQAGVHSGLFFGWAVRRGLTLPWLEDRTPEAFAAFRRGERTGPELLAAWDGAILDDMFTDEGLAFVVDYFDLRSGAFLGDYLATLARDLPSEFHVPDDAESDRRLSEVLDRRWAEWRAGWDPAAGRPDLRVGLEEVDAGPLPDALELPVLPVTSGVVLPGGPLGVRAARPDSLRAVEQALRGDRRLALLTVLDPAHRAAPRPEDLAEVGVVAEIRSARPAEDRPGARDVVLHCLARIERRAWTTEGRARFEVPPPPVPDEDEDVKLEEVRATTAEVVRRRAERGEPPGLLALASVVRGVEQLDAVARALPMTREELLTVLEAPDAGTRADVVLDALRRES